MALPTFAEYQKNFEPLEVPIVLQHLFELQNQSEGAYFCQGFALLCMSGAGPRSYSQAPTFLESIVEFAQADSGGSSYAFWRRDGNVNLSEVPVLAFGSEGGIHVVAENAKGLVALLGLDVAPSIDWAGVVYFRGEDHVPSGNVNALHALMDGGLKVDRVNEGEHVVKAAQDKYEAEFQSWLKVFYPPPPES